MSMIATQIRQKDAIFYFLFLGTAPQAGPLHQPLL